MFTVTFYNFAKRNNSTKIPSSSTTQESFNCKLLAPSSVTAPVLEVAGISNPAQYNYARIQDFGRYYYVTEWVNDGVLWIAHLKVDALATYKTEIGDSTQYLVRTSSAADPNIPDRMYSPTLTKEEGAIEGTNNWTLWSTSGLYVVHQVGLFHYDDGTTDDPLPYVAMNQTALNGLLKAIRVDQSIPLFSTDMFSRLISVIWLPISYDNLPYQPHVASMWAGTITFDFKKIPDTNSLVWGDSVIGVHPGQAIPVPSWHNSNRAWDMVSPYAEYTLSWYPWGLIQLDSVEVAVTHTIYLTVTVDMKTGAARLIARSSSGGHLMFDQPASLAVEIPIHASSINGGAVMSGLTAAGTLIAGIATENVAIAASGVAGMIGSAADIAKGVHHTKGNTGSRVSIETSPTLIYTFYKPTDINYQEVGYPRCVRAQISANAGYIVCATPYVQLAGTESEKAEVYQYMTGGFFYE